MDAVSNDTRKVGMMMAVLAAGFLMVMPEFAFAGTGGTEFTDVWDWLKDNIQGTGGRLACGFIVILGVLAGMSRGSILGGFAGGIGGGVGLYNTPTVLESLVSATLPVAHTTAPIIQTLSNGL